MLLSWIAVFTSLEGDGSCGCYCLKQFMLILQHHV